MGQGEAVTCSFSMSWGGVEAQHRRYSLHMECIRPYLELQYRIHTVQGLVKGSVKAGVCAWVEGDSYLVPDSHKSYGELD